MSKVEIEKIVLGAFVLNEENFWSCHERLSLSLFSNDDHQKIYVTIDELASRNKAIRPSLIASRMSKLSDGQDTEAYLSMLMHIASKEEHIPLLDYIDELSSEAKRKALIDFAEKLLNASKDLAQDPDRLIDRANQRIADMSNSSASETESTISSNISEIVSTAKAKAGSGHGTGVGIQPFLRGIENMVGYIPTGSLVLWGGSPGSAKTSAAIQQAMFTGMTRPSTLFQLEMSSAAMVSRAVQHYTGVRSRDVMSGMTDEQIERMADTGRTFENHRMRIITPKRMDIAQLKARAYAHKRRYGTVLFVVDHLKLLERHSKYRMDPVERAYENTRDLKEMAKELDAVVIVLCQLTKAARQKEQPEPEMEDFYGGSLEEHADLMLANFNRNAWLIKNPPRTNSATVKVDWEDKIAATKRRMEVYKLKDRFGSPRDMCDLFWDGDNTMLHDLPSEADQTLLAV